MQYEIRRMSETNRRISDTLPPTGRVNEVCREWIVHEDGALAYRLQKQEVEQHYVQNKTRNALVREDFPKAKEEQEKEIMEAAEKYRQMVAQQEKIDSTYARRVAEKLERDEYERRKCTELSDQEMAKRMQAYETVKNANADVRLPMSKPSSSSFLPDVNRVGLPLVDAAEVEGEDDVAGVGSFKPSTNKQHRMNATVTHNFRNLKLENSRVNDNSGKHASEMEAVMTRTSPDYDTGFGSIRSSRTTRTPTPATLLPDDLNEIITDVDLQEEANRRLQEEKDAELARMLQKQEEEIFNEEIDRDRLIAIETQDKELAKLLYEKEKAKVKRAKERARQRAMLRKQQAQNTEENTSNVEHAGSDTFSNRVEPRFENNQSIDQIVVEDEESHNEEGNERFRSTTMPSSGRSSLPMKNVAMHIDPTYLSQQQSSSIPNSLIFQDGENAAPPYMPIQGQRRNPPCVEKKQKKSKPKDGCKQQ